MSTLLMVGCASSDGLRRAKPMDPDKVPATLSAAEALLGRGDDAPLRDLERTVKQLRSARVTEGVDADVRRRVQVALERGADDMIRRSDDPDALEKLIESELPMRLAARAGVRAASIEFEDGDRMDAFKTIRALDRRYPTHTLRTEAGELLSKIGMSLADDRGHYLLFFSYRALAPQVLEYLALEYPNHAEADDALNRLATIYEERRLWRDAIQKHQELVLWAPDSPFRIASEAAIPRLRLRSLDRPDYARDTLQRTRVELESWLEVHPDHELRPDVELMLVDARQRLADNDLFAARFYAKVDSAAGIRFHALRAEEEARRAGNLEQVAEAEALLAQAIAIPAKVQVEREPSARDADGPGRIERPVMPDALGEPGVAPQQGGGQ
ncbi:MAG: hypothetical protein R3F49_23055 [Planctomycetota bacterium]